ncbi:hypothetical protein NW766_006490 [Fusarium irregulare]|uniref:Uncharacterized protein n=1 Tax=Fusarium irregulare TaxID=2494466 RepID=A0A9W8PQJ1_9HYPO|nr:hypothetical protein NW766_006490 [Fusarium irregulare]
MPYPISNERSKGKNAAILLPEGRLVFANALSHEMGVSHRLEICDTPAPTPEEVHMFFKQLSEDSRKAYGTRASLILEQRFHRAALLPSHIPSEDVLVGRHGVPVVVCEAAPFMNDVCLPVGFHSP